MRYGYTGRIIRVDLSQQRIKEETLDENEYRLFPGGKALAAYILLKEMTKGVEPLSPQNILVLACGVLTGAPFSTTTRFTAAARSPLTGAYGESEAGGYWGPELKMAGYEAVIITGKADHPVYLWIQDGSIELRDARHLWGQPPDFVQTTIRQELGDEKIQVLQIGVAGENLVRYASLTHNMRHYNGRTGMGAVMGSKNLKAVAVRGKPGRYKQMAYDPQSLAELSQTLVKRVKEHPQSWELHEKGTPGLVDGLNAGGMLPTRNYRSGSFEGVDGIKWESYEKGIMTKHVTCQACAVRCKPYVKVNDRYQVKESVGGPEYEAVAGFGANCGVSDIQAVAKANELCNTYVMDTISTSGTIAFAMECFEKGLIDTQDTNGLELRFGNVEAMLQAIEWIAHRKGFGDLLAEGSRRAAEKIGKNASAYAIHVKSQELAYHDPRGKVNVGIGYAVSETGADHLVSIHDTALQNPESVSFKAATKLGIKNALPARLLNEEKVAMYYICEKWLSVGKVLGLCYFGPAPRSFIQPEEVVEAVRAATGWDVDIDELLKIGDRAINLARLFNVREGFRRSDDTLPARLFTPSESGTLAGVAYPEEAFHNAITELYRLKGWELDSGIPTKERLEELGIGWAVDLIGND